MRRLLPLGLAALLCIAMGMPLAATPPKPAATPAPDPAMLEFLADWQGANGDWVDPLTFTRIDPKKAKAAHKSEPKPPAPATAAPDAQAQAR